MRPTSAGELRPTRVRGWLGEEVRGKIEGQGKGGGRVAAIGMNVVNGPCQSHHDHFFDAGL